MWPWFFGKTNSSQLGNGANDNETVDDQLNNGRSLSPSDHRHSTQDQDGRKISPDHVYDVNDRNSRSSDGNGHAAAQKSHSSWEAPLPPPARPRSPPNGSVCQFRSTKHNSSQLQLNSDDDVHYSDAEESSTSNSPPTDPETIDLTDSPVRDGDRMSNVRGSDVIRGGNPVAQLHHPRNGGTTNSRNNEHAPAIKPAAAHPRAHNKVEPTVYNKRAKTHSKVASSSRRRTPTASASTASAQAAHPEKSVGSSSSHRHKRRKQHHQQPVGNRLCTRCGLNFDNNKDGPELRATYCSKCGRLHHRVCLDKITALCTDCLTQSD